MYRFFEKIQPVFDNQNISPAFRFPQSVGLFTNFSTKCFSSKFFICRLLPTILVWFGEMSTGMPLMHKCRVPRTATCLLPTTHSL